MKKLSHEDFKDKLSPENFETLKSAVEAARTHTKELNEGPMKHTIARRKALEAKNNKRRK